MGILILKKLLAIKYIRGGFILLSFYLSSSIYASTVHDNLAKKFPGCIVTESVLFLDTEQVSKMNSVHKEKKTSAFYAYYEKKCSDKKTRLFVLNDEVRTLKQFVLFEVLDNRIIFIEVLKFLEPAEYKVQPYWLEKFYSLEDLSKLKTVDGVSGATLTSNSIKYLAWLSLYLNGIIKK